MAMVKRKTRSEAQAVLAGSRDQPISNLSMLKNQLRCENGSSTYTLYTRDRKGRCAKGTPVIAGRRFFSMGWRRNSIKNPFTMTTGLWS